MEYNKLNIADLFPDDHSSYPFEIQMYLSEYLSQLNNMDKKACYIAKKHLGSSYDILRSNGFIAYLQKKQK